MKNTKILLIASILWSGLFMRAQSFDVASVKAYSPSMGIPIGMDGFMPGGETFHAQASTLRMLLGQAYDPHGNLTGGPPWISEDRWVVFAKSEKPVSTHIMRIMLQHLLADRFKVAISHYTKEGLVYVFTVAPGGLKLTPSPGAIGGPPSMDGASDRAHQALTCSHCELDKIIGFLSLLLRGPVDNRLGIDGNYDFKHFEFLTESILPQGSDEAIPASGDTLVAALRKYLGIQVEKASGPVDFIRVISASKPTPN